MKKIEAIIKPYVLEEVKAGLHEIGLVGMTVTEVRGYAARPPLGGATGRLRPNGAGSPYTGREVGAMLMYPSSTGAASRGAASPFGMATYDDFVPSLKIELVLEEGMVDEAVTVLLIAGQLRNFAAGELVVHSLVDVIRIRTEEHLEEAI